MAHVAIVPSDLLNSLEETTRSSSSSHPSSEGQRFLRLPHPRTGLPSLFLPHVYTAAGMKAECCILEVQAVSPHSSRSWFLDEGQVIADGKLLLMTLIDPIFLLIPILQAVLPVDGTAGNFRPCEDIFEEAASRLSVSAQGTKDAAIKSEDVMTLASLACVQNALQRMCDFKEITEELSVYRFSRPKLLDCLLLKITHLSRSETFDSFPSLQRGLARDGLLDEGKEDMRQAGRTRAACEVLSQYLPRDVMSELIASYDFTALDTHAQSLLEEASTLPVVRAAASVQERGNEKKRKAVSQLSTGVSKLMKVNTSGMSKISSFFKKPAK